MNVADMMEISLHQCLCQSNMMKKTIWLSKWCGGDCDPQFDPVADHCWSLSEDVEEDIQLVPQTEVTLPSPITAT